MSAAGLTTTVGGLAVVVGVLVWSLVTRRQRRVRFESRPDLSLEQIYREFFGNTNLPRDLVCELWKEVAEPLHLSPGKLRPDDRFDKELAPPKGWEWDDDMVEVQWAVERRLKRIGVKADLSGIHNLRDYVEFFCNLARENATSHDR